MYGQESGGALAATGTGVIIAGQHFNALAIASIGGVLVLLGLALTFTFRRTRKGRR